MPGELIATLVTAFVLAVTILVVPGGRVLVLPEIFTLVLVLLYWAAKPKPTKAGE